MLVVHLKRFSASGTWRRKLDTPVDFPLEGLDLAPYIMASRSAATLPPIYDLVAVSNHFGSTGGGHYTAFAKHSVDGRWYGHGDSHVPRTPTLAPTESSPRIPNPNQVLLRRLSRLSCQRAG